MRYSTMVTCAARENVSTCTAAAAGARTPRDYDVRGVGLRHPYTPMRQCSQAVTHELVIGEIKTLNASSASSLAAQVLQPLRSHTVSSVARRIPYEPNPEYDAARLAWEFSETWSFQQKQLKKDPRVQPEDIQPTYGHLAKCTACEHRAEMAQVLRHGGSSAPLKLGHEWQLLVDDYLVDTWRNLVRFLKSPTSQKVVMKPRRTGFARFGCPCSIIQPKQDNDSFRLYYASGQVAGETFRYREWPKEMRVATSSDGVNWGSSRVSRESARSVILDNGHIGMTGTFTAAESRGRSETLIAGYEGANSKACLARSVDGIFWSTISTSSPLVSSRFVYKPRQHGLQNRSFDTPLHLLKSSGRYNLRSNKEVRRLCFRYMRACEQNGTGWGHKGQMMACLLDLFRRDIIKGECHDVLLVRYSLAPIDCADGSSSRLGRAADSYVQPIRDAQRGRHLVWYRRDFGGPGGWREIRGVQAVEVNSSSLETLPDLRGTPLPRVASYYLDRMGKLERFRRQIYTLTLSQHSNNLWIGLMTVIEWAKDLSEAAGSANRAFQRDTTNVYLVTSRDGVHIDDEWVYAQRPLIPKGRVQAEWNSGFLLPAAHIVSDRALKHTRIYFESRRVRHEERFSEVATIGMASWRLDRLAGIRPANPESTAFFVTKPLLAEGRSFKLLLNAELSQACRGSIGVVLVYSRRSRPLSRNRNSPFQGSVRPSKREIATTVQWSSSAGRSASRDSTETVSVEAGSSIRLRFILAGSARLYGFKLVWEDESGATSV